MISTSPVADPSLAGLVPRPSPWRNVVALVLAVAVLVAVGVLGVRGRVGLVSNGYGSSLLPAARAVVDRDVVVNGWPGPSVTGVTPPAGTREVGTWLVPASAIAGVDRSEDVLTWLEQHGDAYTLPAHASTAGVYRLVELIEIVDCGLFTAEPDPFGDGSAWATGGAQAGPQDSVVHLRTAIGTTADVAVPGSGWTREDVEQYSGCPAGT